MSMNEEDCRRAEEIAIAAADALNARLSAARSALFAADPSPTMRITVRALESIIAAATPTDHDSARLIEFALHRVEERAGSDYLAALQIAADICRHAIVDEFGGHRRG